MRAPDAKAAALLHSIDRNHAPIDRDRRLACPAVLTTTPETVRDCKHCQRKAAVPHGWHANPYPQPQPPKFAAVR